MLSFSERFVAKRWVVLLGLILVLAAGVVARGQVFPPSGGSPSTYQPTTPSFVAGMDAPDRELDERVRSFFGNLSAGVPTAFEDFLKSGPLGASLDATKMGELRSQFEAAKQQLGGYRTHEKIDAKFVGKDVVVLRYLYKGEFSPMVWTVTFYRVTSGSSSTASWFVISLRFDTNIEQVAATM